VIDSKQALVLTVRDGARICVPDDIRQITSYVILEQEDWFEDEIRFVRRWLQPGMQAVDVGSSYGMYTLAMAHAVGGGGRIWAFEPTPRSADYLQHSLDLNACSQVLMSRAAVSAQAGTVAFASGTYSELNAIGGASGGTLQVQAVTLDQMAAAHGWNDVDFVKLDVEGHEIEALRGGAKFFDSSSPLVMLEVKSGERLKPETLEPLLAAGYEAYRLLPGPLMLVPFDPLEPMDGFLLNLFACKGDRARKLAEGGLLAAIGEPAGEKAEKGAWAAFVGSAAYARDLAADWRSSAGFFSSSDHGTYFEGLGAFARSRDANLAPAGRLAWLNRALQCVADAIGANDTLARRLSYARVAAELGWRSAAAECLGLAIERMADGNANDWQEPFIAPSERYERTATHAGRAEWLTCAVVEQYEKLRHYSSLYVDKTSLEVLAPIGDLPYRSAEVDRRRQLVRRRHGLPPLPASPLLLAASEENLNPEYWGAR
jgi:FkbM family methyltransferase